MDRIHDYLSLMQFRILGLLLLSALAGFFTVKGKGISAYSLPALAFVFIGVLLGGMGAELLNKVLEIDIDKKMGRTKRRTGVVKRIGQLNGTAWGVSLAALGIAAGGMANGLTALMIALGITFYILVYTAMLKRRSRFSVIVGGLAGSFCVWAGAAASGALGVGSFGLGLLVLFWIPGHIWSLALKYRKDYIKAGIPMLTAVESPRRGAAAIGISNAMMALLSLLIAPSFGIPYAAIIIIPLLVIVYLSYRVVVEHSSVWRLFKFSSPYLAFVFLAVIISALIHSSWLGNLGL